MPCAWTADRRVPLGRQLVLSRANEKQTFSRALSLRVGYSKESARLFATVPYAFFDDGGGITL